MNTSYDIFQKLLGVFVLAFLKKKIDCVRKS